MTNDNRYMRNRKYCKNAFGSLLSMHSADAIERSNKQQQYLSTIQFANLARHLQQPGIDLVSTKPVIRYLQSKTHHV
jgi:hypothetical protein